MYLYLSYCCLDSVQQIDQATDSNREQQSWIIIKAAHQQ